MSLFSTFSHAVTRATLRAILAKSSIPISVNTSFSFLGSLLTAYLLAISSAFLLTSLASNLANITLGSAVTIVPSL